MNLPKFSISQPVLVNMGVVLVLVAGVGTFTTMIKEEWPDIGATHAQITVAYPGASPREVEKLVIVPIEDRIDTVQEIKTITSVSSEGRGRLFVEFNPNVSDYDLRLQELQREVGATPDLPDEVGAPVVKSFRFGNSRVIDLALNGQVPEAVLQRAARDLEDDLKRIPGVERVEVVGKREREIWVEISPHAMHSYNLALQDVIVALQRANQNVSGGTVESGAQEYLVRTVGEVGTITGLNSLVVKRGPYGEHVYLSDVATLRDTFEKPLTLGRINGQPSVRFELHKVVGGDALDIVATARRVATAHRADLPPGLEIVEFHNSAEELEKRLSSLYSNGLLGLVLVLGCLYAFVGTRPAIMTAAGIPFSLLFAFVILNLVGITINSLVLFSLIIVLGMIVDDAIVVTENVYRYYEQGESREAAVIKGVNEVFWPVVSAVLTTIAAFLPLMLMSGWLGKYMAFIPKTAIIVLGCSLVECLFVLPSHLYDFPPRRAQAVAAGQSSQRRQWLRSLMARYARLLRWCLRRRYAVVGCVLVAATGAIWLVKSGRLEIILFGGRDASNVEVQFEVAEGTKLEETLKAATILEATSMNLPKEEYNWVFTNVGSKGWRAERAYVSNAGRVDLDLVHHTDRDRSSKDIISELRRIVADYPVLRNVIFHEEFIGPAAGEAVELAISGPDFETLRELSAQVRAFLAEQPGVSDARDNFLAGKDEVQILVDEEKAHLSGLDLRRVAETARAALFGVEATAFYDDDEDVPVRVRYHQAAREDFTNLEWLEIVNAQGERVPFTNVARTVRKPGLARIIRRQGERTVTVYANVDDDVTTSQRVNEALKAAFEPRLAAYPGYDFHFGGEYEETNESVASLFQAFFIGAVLIYMILGTQFKSFIQPLVVLAAVPFSFIGVVVGFLLLDEPLGMMSLIGVIALVGIVVNDSLILVDFINRSRATGSGKQESIVRSGMVRLRPILLTSVTTIAGLMPMAIGVLGVDDFLRPMAISIACGLTFATILTLIYIPVFYAIIVDDLQPRLAALARFLLGRRTPPPPAPVESAVA